MLRLAQVSKTFYKGTINEKQALKDLDLHLEPGDFVTIIGSNGAGKSTLFHAIGGSFLVDTGAIVLDGKNITAMPEYKRSFDIGRLMQDPMKGTAPSMTVEENLALAHTRKAKKSLFAINKRDTEVFREMLSRLELGLEERMKTKVKNLSGGQRQAVTLLMCTIASPKLLLLDEHTAALDPATAVKIMDITREVVAESNITTMMITHDIRSALSVGNRTIMMDEGEVILDIRGEERENMSVEKLLSYYSAKKHKQLADDRILLA
ncbi:ATP-binding cassette domain-containing protein [Alkalibacter rhizosphaerae]|uniref:ATP-binding cassette domain-containing protein n=1 Tax=Alkalibacter rhizosphaerae TaxID=2815577 RepID=A0A975AIT9_9FIRM|nr:ATP-binding cassette domain-containing protein [Alkalibacter rhizosphaerae]QSX09024.1 ATP-binding cassette domain-containing protein [Alkalibacter rhizosphaerae]